MNPDPFEADLAAVDHVSGLEILAATDGYAAVDGDCAIVAADCGSWSRLRRVPDHDSEWFERAAALTDEEQAEFVEWWQQHRAPVDLDEPADFVDWRDPWGNSIS